MPFLDLLRRKGKGRPFGLGNGVAWGFALIFTATNLLPAAFLALSAATTTKLSRRMSIGFAVVFIGISAASGISWIISAPTAGTIILPASLLTVDWSPDHEMEAASPIRTAQMLISGSTILEISMVSIAAGLCLLRGIAGIPSGMTAAAPAASPPQPRPATVTERLRPAAPWLAAAVALATVGAWTSHAEQKWKSRYPSRAAIAWTAADLPGLNNPDPATRRAAIVTVLNRNGISAPAPYNREIAGKSEPGAATVLLDVLFFQDPYESRHPGRRD